MTKILSIIIPSYNEEGMIEQTAKRIASILQEGNIDYELIFVDDGSTDDTWRKILQVSEMNSCCHGVHFSRNFGKEAAISAGLDYMNGDAAVIIDCDLQHPPEKILEMYELWDKGGNDIVEAVKRTRGDESFLHKCFANLFYKMISASTGIDMMRSSDYKLLDRSVVDVLKQMKEIHSFFRAQSFWIGGKTAQIEFDVAERTDGKSKWSMVSLVKYAISNITSFSATPLYLVTIMGAIFMVIAVIFGGIALVQKFMGVALTGFTTVILLLLIANSFLMISLGIIGYYMGKMYDEIKKRPKYIISKKC